MTPAATAMRTFTHRIGCATLAGAGIGRGASTVVSARLLLLLLVCALCGPLALSAHAQVVPASSDAAEAPSLPDKLTVDAVDPFVAQLTDAQARTLLIDELRAQAGTAGDAPAPEMASASLLEMLRDRTAQIGQRFDEVGAAFERVPRAHDIALRNLTDQKGYPAVFRALGVLLAMIAIGVVAELALRALTGHARQRLTSAVATAWSERLSTLALRLAIDLLSTVVFGVAAYLASLIFFARYDPLREFVTALLLTIVAARLGRDLSAFVLAPRAPQLRLVLIDDLRARRLHLWIVTLATATGFAVFSLSLLRILGVEPDLLLAYQIVTGLLVLLLLSAAIWTLREPRAEAAAQTGVRALLRQTWHLFAIAYLVLVWCVWSSNLLLGREADADTAMQSLIIVLAVVAADQIIFGALYAAFAPAAPAAAPDGADAALPRRSDARRLLAIIQVIVRTLFVGVAVLLLADAWGLGLLGLFETPIGHQVASAVFNIAVTLILAAAAWHAIRHFIDRQIAKAEAQRPTEGAAAQFGTRAETLLPLLRNFVMIVLLVLVTMIVLSSLGVDIGPLIAGAGIVGLAIGFGSQTLVRDIVSGVFFLIEDAFRVGEYVETGNKRGTVEAISLRSLQLRHHRGPLHTVPFGELQAVTNYSRGWVIEKLELNVPYDTDIDKVKRLIKQVGKEISELDEFKKVILEPPKSQGVDRMADFSAVVRVKFKTLPGEQFQVRRELYKRIKSAFAENGIKFAYPTVTIHQTGGRDADPATPTEVADAAAAALGLAKPSPPAA